MHDFQVPLWIQSLRSSHYDFPVSANPNVLSPVQAAEISACLNLMPEQAKADMLFELEKHHTIRELIALHDGQNAVFYCAMTGCRVICSRKCAKCLKVRYCGGKHQHAHWAEHKRKCQEANVPEHVLTPVD